jgi:hypothetical protein
MMEIMWNYKSSCVLSKKIVALKKLVGMLRDMTLWNTGIT